jgi:hypothetical protein
LNNNITIELEKDTVTIRVFHRVLETYNLDEHGLTKFRKDMKNKSRKQLCEEIVNDWLLNVDHKWYEDRLDKGD